MKKERLNVPRPLPNSFLLQICLKWSLPKNAHVYIIHCAFSVSIPARFLPKQVMQRSRSLRSRVHFLESGIFCLFFPALEQSR